MKKIILPILGSVLQVGLCFAYNDDWAKQGQNIMDALKSFDSKTDSNYRWESTRPTAEDIQSANRVENLAVEGSREDKLINAVKNGDLKNVKAFIAAGADLEARDNQDRTALMRAAEKGDSDAVKVLLDEGANVSTKDKFGWTAFFIAADKNHVEVVKILIARGAASDKNFNDIFVSSVFKGNTEMVKALVGESANIDCRTIDEASCVVNYRNTEMVNIIERLKSKCKRY